MQKVVIISHQSLKKGHREGKNIPPGQIPLYAFKVKGFAQFFHGANMKYI